MKKCPYCAEEVKDEAVVCHYCGRDLSVPPLPFVIIQEPKKRREAKKVVEEPETQLQIVKKKDFSIAVLFTVIIGLVACVVFAMVQSNWTSSPPPDSASIQNTAVAMAWTSVSQTQIASTPPPPKSTKSSATENKTSFEFKVSVYKFMEERYKYYDAIAGEYSGDKYTKQVFQDASDKFGISLASVDRIWSDTDVFNVVNGSGSSDSSDSLTEPTEDEKAFAWGAAKQEVLKRLKSPATAEFPFSYLHEYIMKSGDTIIVKSYVDSENSFGAKLRATFQVIIEQTDSEHYNMISVDIYE